MLPGQLREPLQPGEGSECQFVGPGEFGDRVNLRIGHVLVQQAVGQDRALQLGQQGCLGLVQQVDPD